jgi:hypothetical protein
MRKGIQKKRNFTSQKLEEFVLARGNLFDMQTIQEYNVSTQGKRDRDPRQ